MMSKLPPGYSLTQIESESCDVVVINTCMVTSKAEADCRKYIRRTRKEYPKAKIIVTGCASQVNPEKWASMPEVDQVIGIFERDKLDEILVDGSSSKIIVSKPSGGVLGPTPLTGHRSRPFLKIQDGCSRGCSYCIVPFARGPERSRPLNLIKNDIAKLIDSGYKEIVLTGVHLGRWGQDINLSLEHLLEVLAGVQGARIRFSSIEPMDINKSHIRMILTNPRICPHLHVPLQSGDNRILQAMKRGHQVDDYLELVGHAISINPDVAIGTDIMTGFPGEDDLAFRNTMEVLSKFPFAYLHVFKFSPRPGTCISRNSNEPSGVVTSERMKQLKNLDICKRREFAEKFHGRIMECLVEAPEEDSKQIIALTGNFIHISIDEQCPRSIIGQLKSFVLDTISGDGKKPSGKLV